MRLSALVVLAALAATPALAEAPGLPADAKQLTGAEIPAWLDGKQFSVVIYDAPAPIKATVNWDFKKRIVYGDYVMNGEKGTFENPLTVKGDTVCGEKNAKGAWVCQRVFVKGKTMYEINKAGQVHAVSKLR